MFRYNDGQFRVNPPVKVVVDGFKREFFDLTRKEWDELGYNEAVPLTRESFTTYETRWVKGDDLIYSEEIVSAFVDEEEKTRADAGSVRGERDRRLRACDWTQVVDCPLKIEEKTLWTAYRQGLRDVPQQDGFPGTVEWPSQPDMS